MAFNNIFYNIAKKITIFAVFFAFSNNLLFGQAVQFTFNTFPYTNPSIVNSGLSVSSLTISTGTLATNLTTGDYFPDEPYVGSSGGWSLLQIEMAKSFGFNITAAKGFGFKIDSLSVQGYATSAGPNRCAFMVNNEIFDTLSITSSAIFNYIQTVQSPDSLYAAQVKLVGFNTGATSGAGDFRIDNLQVYCTIFTVPLPDSNSTISAGVMIEPTKISSLVTQKTGIPVLDFVISDSATTDILPTIIDSLSFDFQGIDGDVKLSEVLGGALLTGDGLGGGIEVVIRENTLFFDTQKGMQIPSGSKGNYQLNVWLNPDFLLTDHLDLSLSLQQNMVYTDAKGSSVGFGSAELSPFELEVVASQLQAEWPNRIIFADSTFSITVLAADAHGNVDADYSGNVSLESSSDVTILESQHGLSAALTNGMASFTALKFTNSDSTSMNLSVDGLPVIEKAFCIVKPTFYDSFESQNLDQWYNSNDWTLTTVDAIHQSGSLKHNLSNVAGTSYIASTQGLAKLNWGTTIWRLVLRNGDFDPTSSNRFWYYLMASDSNLLSPQNTGYVVGVNFSGSSDTLSLWRMGEGNEKQLLTHTTFNWDATQTVGIEVSRTVQGLFQLGFDAHGTFDSVVFAPSISDTVFEKATAHGLVFNYSNTRAGLLWADEVQILNQNTSPVLVSAKALSRNQISVRFSEPLWPVASPNLSDFSLTDSAGAPVLLDSLNWWGNNPNEVLLSVKGLRTGKYTLSAKGLFDSDSMPMLAQLTTFVYEATALPFDVVFNEIMFDPSPVVGLPEYDYLTIINRGSDTYNLQNWVLEVNGVRKLLPARYILKGQEVIVTSSGALEPFSTFGPTVVGINSTALTIGKLSLKLITPQGLLADSVVYNPLWITDEAKQDGGWSLERIDANNLCSSMGNWKVSESSSGGTPGQENSVLAENLDQITPALSRVDLVAPNLIDVEFSETMSPLSMKLLQNFIVSNNISRPDSVWLNVFPATYRLRFAKPLQSGVQYSLLVKNLFDECGNVMNDTLLSIGFYKPQPNDLVFNEIMADAKPAVGLPEVQYIELYNRSAKTVELNGFTLRYGNYSKEFVNIDVLPHSYLLVCPNGQGAELMEFGPVADILSTTTLTSAGRALQLADTSGQIIASVNYTADWYRNPDKADGGWSLERIDPDNLCSQADNWQASLSQSGGTPGMRNSVYGKYSDVEPPKIVSAKCISDHQLQVKFSEPIAEAAITTQGTFGVSPDLGIDTVAFSSVGNSVILLTFIEKPVPGEHYQVTVSSISDACGNAMTDTTLSFVRTNLAYADVVITEVMVDPIPVVQLPEFEYLELYNRSPFSVNLDRLNLWVNQTRRTLPDFELLPGHYVVLCEEKALPYFASTGSAVAIQSFVAMPNQSGKLVLTDTTGFLVYQINYDESWYHDSEKDNGGWSLEMIDWENHCGPLNNYTASADETGGTPGRQNSVFRVNLDTVAPKIIMVLPTTERSLVVEFSELIDSVSVFNPANYTISSIGNPVSIQPDSANPLVYHLVFGVSFKAGTDYQLLVKRLGDECGNVMANNTFSILYDTPAMYDLVINEVMFKPLEQTWLPYPEYIEIYNRSNKQISMFNWSIKVKNSTWKMDAVSILPQGYLILTAPGLVHQLDEFGNCAGVPLWTDLPSEAELTLMDQNGDPVAVSAYNSDWITDDIQLAGGYSLERVNPENPDESSKNWIPSANLYGGTPGSQNSAFNENSEEANFKLEHILPLSSTKLQLRFNQVIDANSLLPEYFSVPDFSGTCARVNYSPIGFRNLELTFDAPFDYGVLYALSVADGFTGFNHQKPEIVQPFFALPDTVGLPRIALSEILFNPPTGGADFVEVYNHSQSFYNLANLSLASRNSAGNVTDIKVLMPQGYLLFPGQYAVFTTNADWVMKAYIENGGANILNVSGLPSMADDKGTVVLLYNTQIIDELSYTDEMHFKLLSTFDGVSLERINYDAPTNEATNWHSAAETAGWGTPGLQNSAYRDAPDQQGELTVEPEVFSPDNDGFDDQVNFLYRFDEPGYVANVYIFSVKGGMVRRLAANTLLQPQGQFSWDGLTDDGRLAPVGMYVAYFEVFNLNGDVKKFRRVCVLASKF